MLRGKRIVVTGSTQGIGLGIAQSLLKNGSKVVINSKDPVSSELMYHLSKLGEVFFVQANLAKPQEAKRLIQESANHYGSLDHLINNAGTFADTNFLDMEESHFDKTFNLNVKGYFFAAQEFVRIVGKRNWDASIVSIGSTNSLQAEAGSVLYDSSKGAILMMVRSLAVELAAWGIRSNGIGPGLVETNLTSNWMKENPALKKMIEAQIPIGRVGQPSDIGGTACFLCSEAAQFITGQMIYVDGGIVALQMTKKCT